MELKQPVQKPTAFPGIISIVIAILLLVFIGLPKFNSWNENQAQVKTLTAANQQLDGASAAVAQNVSQIESDNNLQSAALAIPNQADTADLYAHLEKLTKNANLLLTSIQVQDQTESDQAGAGPTPTPAGPSTTGPIGTSVNSADAGASAFNPNAQTVATPSPTLGLVTVNMAVKGNYAAINNFLSALNKSLRFIDVTSIDVASDQSQSDPNSISFKLVMNTYYEKGGAK